MNQNSSGQEAENRKLRRMPALLIDEDIDSQIERFENKGSLSLPKSPSPPFQSTINDGYIRTRYRIRR